MVVKSFNQITLETSKKMGKAALKKALEIKVPVVRPCMSGKNI